VREQNSQGRTSQETNEPEGESAKVRVHISHEANKPWDEKAKGRISQRAKGQRGEKP